LLIGSAGVILALVRPDVRQASVAASQ